MANAVDEARKRKRLNLTVSPEADEMADEMAVRRGLSVSTLFETLVRAEVEREARKKRTKSA